MIPVVTFFWRRIFPLVLVVVAVVMAFRDNYVGIGIALALAIVFWTVGGKMMTSLWYRWTKMSLWLFWLVFVGLIAVGYYIYSTR